MTLVITRTYAATMESLGPDRTPNPKLLIDSKMHFEQAMVFSRGCDLHGHCDRQISASETDGVLTITERVTSYQKEPTLIAPPEESISK